MKKKVKALLFLPKTRRFYNFFVLIIVSIEKIPPGFTLKNIIKYAKGWWVHTKLDEHFFKFEMLTYGLGSSQIRFFLLFDMFIAKS